MHNRTHDSLEENNTSSHLEQAQGSKPEQFTKEKKPLPENITEYIQKVRDELKEYEEKKNFYERRRKKEIVLQLIDLLEEHEYPKEWLRLIIAQELGDYISTSYIEKILADKYPVEEKKVKKQSTSQTEEIPQNDNKIPIEISSAGESIVINDKSDSDGTNLYQHKSHDVNLQVPTDIEVIVEQQVEQDEGDKVRILETKVRDLQAKCSRFEELANETLMWKEKSIQLQRELEKSKFNEMKIIKGKTEIEFGSEFLPLTIEYNPQTNQFSARIPQEAIDRVLSVLRRRR